MGFVFDIIPDQLWLQVLITLVFVLSFPIGNFVYNLYFHPLSKFPGPLLWRGTRLMHMRASWAGRISYAVRDLHIRYGEVVRVAPNELSFAHSAAWEDIYSNRGSSSAFPKSAVWHGPIEGTTPSVFFTIDFKEHARVRRAMNPAFSERAVARQEFIVQEYVDLFIEKLRQRVIASEDQSTTVNIVDWLNFVLFDITGDLAFGESFHCLEDTKPHDWMSFTFSFIKANYLIISIRHYPTLFRYLMWMIPKKTIKQLEQHLGHAAEKVNRRLNSDVERPDIISQMQARSGKNEEGLSIDEIHANAALFIVAGSETTVTVITGILNHLLQNVESLAQLKNEIRSQFTDAKDISFTALKQLTYLNAVIKEGLRMCNPNAMGHIRITPSQGGTVAGHFVPGNTLVTVHPETLMRSEKHFHNAEGWHPERWLDEATTNTESPYYNDDRKCVHTFGHGPQSCIGEALAWAEMRSILAKTMWNFDVESADTPHSRIVWDQQNVFGVIEKSPLDVKLALKDIT